MWLPRGLLQQCVDEAAHWFPVETGGVLVGYWNAQDAVVTGLIGAGPAAVREAYHFEPDQNWQLEEIALRYRASAGRETYLGDWHTHPNATSGSLSGTDRRVLRDIIEHPKAQAPEPIMMIVFGGDKAWGAAAWVASRRLRRPQWWPANIAALDVKLFDTNA